MVAAGDGDTRGNPAPVVDPRTGAIVLVTSYNSGTVTEAQIMRGEVTAAQSRRVFVQTSGDDGRSFTPPRDITAGEAAQLALVRHRARACRRAHPGAAHGTAGRPANHSAAPTAGSADTGQEAKYYGGPCDLQRRRGVTWRLGFVDATYDGVNNANECPRPNSPTGGCTSARGTSMGPVWGTGSTRTPVTGV